MDPKTSSRDSPIKINTQICSRCGTCVAVCARSALFIYTDRLIHRGDRCLRCGDCTKVCAVYALLQN